MSTSHTASEPSAALSLRERTACITRARRLPVRLHPYRPVVAARMPDPRRPIIRDYTLACGHRYGHVVLRRGADGRFHVATRLRCPLCAVAPTAPAL